MKTIFLLPILFVINFANAQQTCELKFQVISTDSLESDTIFIEIAQTGKKFAVNYTEGDVHERLVVDSTARKIVELTDEDDEKLAFVYDLSDEEVDGNTLAFAIVYQGLLEKEDYRLTSDKKTIQGWNCQKIEFLDEGVVYASGWVALGLHIGFSAEAGFFATKEGSVIEYFVPDDEGDGSISTKLVKSSKTIANPAKVFSLEIPAGYELDTMEDDYYDDGEED